MKVTTQVSVAGCSCLDRRLFPFLIAPVQGRGHAHDGFAEAQSEQLGHNAPDLHSTSRDSNRREHEGRGPIVQQPSEIAPEHTLDDGQDGGDVHGINQSGKSRGKFWRSFYTTVRVNHS